MRVRGSGNEEDHDGANACVYFEEEESDSDEEERNDVEEGQTPVDPLGRGIDVPSCLLLINKSRSKDKIYIWLSVRWKTKT